MNHKESIPYFAADAPFDIVYRKSSTSTPVKPHTHNALEIYFTLTDLPDVLLNDTVSSVPSGSLIVIPPHCVHQLFNQKLTVYERYIITVNSNWILSVFDRDPQLMSYASSSAVPSIITLSSSQVKTLQNKLELFLSSSDSGVAKYSTFFSLLNTTDGYILEGLSQNSDRQLIISQSQQKVNDIIAYINSHITEPIDMATIGDEFHFNKDYLGRLFKEHTHATIGHYISVQRIGLAQNMFSEGHTVSEVQEALGFTSYAYFFKFFKKMTGVSPSQYRKSFLTKS